MGDARFPRRVVCVGDLLPSDEVNRTLFADEQQHCSQVEEDRHSGRLAAMSMDLTRASFLLDSIIRDHGSRLQFSFGFYALYAKGRAYLKKAENQLCSLNFPITGLHAEIELEKIDYDGIQDCLMCATQGAAKQGLLKLPRDINSLHNLKLNDGQLWRDFQMRRWTRHASQAVNLGSLVQEFRTQFEDIVSLFQLWSHIVTAALYTSIHMPNTNSRQSDVQILDSPHLFNLAEAKMRVGIPGSGSQEVIPALLEATAYISAKLGVLVGGDMSAPNEEGEDIPPPADNAYLEILATQYPIRFDVPLYLWTFTRLMQQLKFSNLFPTSSRVLQNSSRFNWQQIGTIAQATQESLPVPNQETLEGYYEKKRLETNNTTSEQTNTLVLGGGPYIIQGNMVVTENTRIVVKDSQGVTVVGDLVVKKEN